MRALGQALFKERSTLGKLQVRYLNLTIFVILLVVAALAVWKIDIKNFTPTLIWVALWIAYAILLAMISENILNRRRAGRQQLYRHWQHTYRLNQFNDTRLDSSVMIGIRWQWLTAEVVRAETHGDLQYNAIGRIRSITQDMQQTFRTGDPWVLSIDELRHGVILGWPVSATSFDYKFFRTQVIIYEIVKNVIDARGLPQLQFEGLQNVNGEVYFDHVLLSNLEAQHFDEHTIDYARRAFLDNFIERPGYVWDVVARGDGTIAFMQVPVGSY